MISGSKWATTVWMASRSLGGVSITDISRKPSSDMCRVRGIGVALMATTSTLLLICFRRSLCLTPKRCSSSTITRPRSLNWTSWERRRWVPIAISTLPAAKSATTSFNSLGERKRLSISTRTGNGWKRCLKVSKCWKQSTVVGASTATCLPSPRALNAARITTSVLPNPTSPHSSRSMGCGLSMSRLISLMAER